MRNHVAAVILILSVITLIFAQTRGFDFVNFDDAAYIYNNPHIDPGLNAATVEWAFTTRYFGNWIPLTWLSYLTDVSIFGKNPGAIHLVNALWHALNSLLLYYAVFLYSRRFRTSLFLALVFAVHPMHVESVAWISERKDVLSTFFGLGVLIAYRHYARHQSVGAYAASLILFACSLMAKPMLITLPLLLVLLDVFPLGRWDTRASCKRVILEKIPFVGLSCVVILITIWAQSGIDAIQNVSDFSLTDRLGNAIYSYAVYVGKYFVPYPLIPFYPHPEDTLALWKPLVAALYLSIVTIGAWRIRRTHPAILMGWSWYMITLLPVIGIIQVGGQAMADRYSYIPYIGLSIAICAATTAAFTGTPVGRNILSVITLTWLIALSGIAVHQTAQWKNTETLFTHALKHSPENLTALTNLGEYSLQQSDYGGAINRIEHALSIQPGSVHNLRNLGKAYRELGRLVESEDALMRAYNIDSEDPDTLNHLALTVLEGQRGEQARTLLERAIALRPDFAEAYNNLGNALLTEDEIQSAIGHFETSLKIEPGKSQTWSNLGAAYLYINDFESAIEPLQTSLQIDPDNAVTRTNYAVALLNLGNPTEALAETQKAIGLNPNYPQAQALLKHIQSLPK